MNQESLLSINSTLDVFFEQSIKEAHQISPSYERLWRGLHTLISSGGKRLRPQMTLLAYAAFGGEDPQSILPVAAAQELLHFSLLIHDDIIDRDDIRYGVANITGQYKSTYAPFVNNDDGASLTHYANSAAILAGDLMLSGAHQLIASSHLPAHAIASAQHTLSRGIFEVAGGELLDTELSFMPYKNGDAILVARYKTAGYSFIAPLLTGAQLANATEEQCNALRECAVALGIAYQLTDDLLGVFGNQELTGKSTSSDITEGKRTYMVEVALDALAPSDMELFLQGFGNQKATEEQIATVRQLFESSGAKRKTEEKINNYIETAIHNLDSLGFPPSHHQGLLELIEKLTSRNS